MNRPGRAHPPPACKSIGLSQKRHPMEPYQNLPNNHRWLPGSVTSARYPCDSGSHEEHPAASWELPQHSKILRFGVARKRPAAARELPQSLRIFRFGVARKTSGSLAGVPQLPKIFQSGVTRKASRGSPGASPEPENLAIRVRHYILCVYMIYE